MATKVFLNDIKEVKELLFDDGDNSAKEAMDLMMKKNKLWYELFMAGFEESGNIGNMEILGLIVLSALEVNNG